MKHENYFKTLEALRRVFLENKGKDITTKDITISEISSELHGAMFSKLTKRFLNQKTQSWLKRAIVLGLDHELGLCVYGIIDGEDKRKYTGWNIATDLTSENRLAKYLHQREKLSNGLDKTVFNKRDYAISHGLFSEEKIKELSN